jgi:spore coat protein SA
MIYHFIGEPFSACTGLALANVAANMMRFDKSSVVVCPEADDTWGFGGDRILVIPQSGILAAEIRGSSMRGWRFVPSRLRRRLIYHIFRSAVSQLKSEDIVWCHNWPYVAESLEREIHSKGAKLIYHAHNSLAPYAGRALFKSFTPDALVFNSEAMRQESLQLMPYLQNTCAIHNAADEALFYPTPADAARDRAVPTILYVGRLVPDKGVHVLMEAMRILYEWNIEAVCKVVGSSHAGERRIKNTAYIRSLQKRRPPNVKFEGFRPATEIAQEYRAADIFCCPSIWQEPFGTVNVEAMASGVPVVATRVGGIPEIAADGGVLLVEPDSGIDLADALRRLILDKDLRAKVGAEGLESFRRRFTWTAIASQYRELIDGLTKRQYVHN